MPKRLRDLRVFLRHCAIAQEAARRPRDFGGLEGWLSEVRSSSFARTFTPGATALFGGPATTTGGLWTAFNITQIPMHSRDATCARCSADAESVARREWLSPRNRDERRALDGIAPEHAPPDDLPPRLAHRRQILAARAAGPARSDRAMVMRLHLSCENAIASWALAAHRAGKPARETAGQPRPNPLITI